MCSNVGVTLLVTLVFLNVVKVISTDDNGAVHLCALYSAAEDATTDGYISGEWALFVDVVTLDSFLGGLESQADGFIPSVSSFSCLLGVLLGDLLVAAKWGIDGGREVRNVKWMCVMMMIPLKKRVSLLLQPHFGKSPSKIQNQGIKNTSSGSPALAVI